jgi:hypothetical protein
MPEGAAHAERFGHAVQPRPQITDLVGPGVADRRRGRSCRDGFARKSPDELAEQLLALIASYVAWSSDDGAGIMS